ncbi:MAG: S8 family peptidase [Chitinophagaceae bacterium]
MSSSAHIRPLIRKSILLGLIILCGGISSRAQGFPEKDELKLSPAVRVLHLSLSSDSLVNLQVITSNPLAFLDSVQALRGAVILGRYAPLNLEFIVTPVRWINRISGWVSTVFIDQVRKASPELFTGTMDGSVNKINLLLKLYPGLNGNSVVMGIKENSFDTTDIDYRGRVLVNPSASIANNSHASIMATIAAGAGNSWYASRGAAWGSRIVSSSFSNLLPDPATFYQLYGVSVQNHSYGTGIENYYGPEAVAYDLQASGDNKLVHVFSAGNSGGQASTSGPYTGISGYANLTGQFKMAKNIITVGATDSFSIPGPMSSKGPAYDGRVKPELVALGEDGSSGAAALTSGVVAVLQDAYRLSHGGISPPASLVKSLLVNSADYIAATGPDYQSGYGSLNAEASVNTLVAGRYATGTIQQAQELVYNLDVPAGSNQVKVTLAWTDPPAAVNANRALVNDLDLILTSPGGLQNFLPWVLSSFPHPDSLAKPATRKRDDLNNLEQVSIDNPVAGTYQVRIRGTIITTAQQEFSISWQVEDKERFEWKYPMRDDPLLGGQVNVLRWKSTLAAATGTLQYSTDGGASWQSIQPGVNLATGYYKWNTPSLFTPCLVRMVAGNNYETDTVVISTRPDLSVGFHCRDSFQLYWHRVTGAGQYRIYRLGSRYLELMNTITDTSVVLQIPSNPSLYYAVAPVKSGREGVKSYALNYTTQGLDCYFRSFYADQSAGTARVQLELGSLFNIRRVIVVKYSGKDSVIFRDFNNPASLLYTLYDPDLRTGATSYRTYLETINGTRIASDLITVLYVSEDRIFVYPNPVRRGQPFRVLLNDMQQGELQLFDAAGRKIRGIGFTAGGILEFETASLPPGIYLVRLAGYTRSVKTGKLVVY